jgi:hypothetical protein
MNENNLANLNNNTSIRILRSSPALPDFRAGALPARIFFARLTDTRRRWKNPLRQFPGPACNKGLE